MPTLTSRCMYCSGFCKHTAQHTCKSSFLTS